MDYTIIGENIKKYRKAKMTQAELAAKINRTESSIRKYEKGLVEIPISVIEKIADILDVELDELIGVNTEINIVEPATDELRKEIRDLCYSLNNSGLTKAKDYMYDLIGNPKYKIGN